MMARYLFSAFALVVLFSMSVVAASPLYNVRDFGAKGDGKTIDSPAINAAIQAASAAGGGTVWCPAGTYASYSVRLESHITLRLDSGATLLAADPPTDGEAGYDLFEPNIWGDEHQYQDFGHSHWMNSLIWGVDLEDVAIIGPGMIDGRGLIGAVPVLLPDEKDTFRPDAQAEDKFLPFSLESQPGNGDKAIAFKWCRNVTLRDFTVFRGGHFALLGTGVDNLTIDNVRVDTNRDGFNFDACRNVFVSNCAVNAPNNDAICLKSSFGLGEARATENVTITNCQVSGFAVGSLLDATFDRTFPSDSYRDGPTGRIKFGTESNGGYKNITISNCVFDRSRGLALEIVDGGTLEDVSITNLTMRDIVNSPIFLRLGNRARGPEGTGLGVLRRVHISDVIVYDADSRYASQIVGLADRAIEDVSIRNVRIIYKGGLTLEQVARQWKELPSDSPLQSDAPAESDSEDPFYVPERAGGYPEPDMFGLLPAYGLYVRHAKGIKIHNVTFEFMKTDTRPAVVLDDVSDVEFVHFKAQTPRGVHTFKLRNVSDFTAHRVKGLTDVKRSKVKDASF